MRMPPEHDHEESAVHERHHRPTPQDVAEEVRTAGDAGPAYEEPPRHPHCQTAVHMTALPPGCRGKSQAAQVEGCGSMPAGKGASQGRWFMGQHFLMVLPPSERHSVLGPGTCPGVFHDAIHHQPRAQEKREYKIQCWRGKMTLPWKNAGHDSSEESTQGKSQSGQRSKVIQKITHG